MPREDPVGLAHPTKREWEEYVKLFEHEPSIQNILRFLKIKNCVQVRNCRKHFGPHTILHANTVFRRAGVNVRLIATPDTIQKPLLEREVCLYQVAVKSSKTPA